MVCGRILAGHCPDDSTMLLRTAVLSRTKQGEISLVFRRWRRPTVRSGGTLRTAIGLLNITDVAEVSDTEITPSDVRRAGYTTRAELIDQLGTRGERLFRVEVAYAGADPHIVLRERDTLSDVELEDLMTRLRRLDRRSASGPWAERLLGSVERHPQVAARILADALDCEKDWLKINVRKLKNLGLTVSHDPGYSLSPRGRIALGHLRKTSDHP
jgi:hypothetical protein